MVKAASNYIGFLEDLIVKGGPTPDEDQRLTNTIKSLHKDWESGQISHDDLQKIRDIMNFTPETIQGFAYLKPNGYAGCFEMIERIYQKYHCENPHLYHWDRYCQEHPATQAVRNRKDYFINLVHQCLQERDSLNILNVASGPCRDIFELFEQTPDLPVKIHCIEQDERAINYAKSLCEPYLENISFHQSNALRFSIDGQFDLVWSAGLFDYLQDSLFSKLIRRLGKYRKPDGELVIGNFCSSNPSRAYMDLCDWILIHRSSDDLRQLALDSGFAAAAIDVRSEELSVNLFLHIKQSGMR